MVIKGLFAVIYGYKRHKADKCHHLRNAKHNFIMSCFYGKMCAQAMSSAKSLIGIITILLQKDKVTAPELARRFEVSRRTINRDAGNAAASHVLHCTPLPLAWNKAITAPESNSVNNGRKNNGAHPL